MKTKIEEAAEQADEPNHSANENKAEHGAKAQENSATPEKGTQIIENQNMDALVEKLRKDWANSDFLKLVNDRHFMKQLERICKDLTNRFRTSPSYSWEDLSQDVITHLVKAVPR